MKASELIMMVQKQIDNYGDLNIVFEGDDNDLNYYRFGVCSVGNISTTTNDSIEKQYLEIILGGTREDE